jgi:hypothetical protein
MLRSASLASLALLLTAAPASGHGEDVQREPGVYWEQSFEMQMAGFSMPAQTHKVCIPKKGLEEPPQSAKDDGKCEMTDVKRTGSRMTWKMRCKDGTTGEGDITSGPDTFDGTMTMRTQGQEVHMKMKGKKVGGDCDAGEAKRKFAALKKQADDAQAQAAESQAKRCEDGARTMELHLFVPPFPNVPVQCKDASRFCANLETREGLVALKRTGGKDGAAKAGKLCKKDVDAVVEKLCAAATKEQQKGTRFSDEASLEFVFGWCPDLAKALAKRECAGRKFTALPPAQRDFCIRWAQKRLEGGDRDEPVRPAAAGGKYLQSGVPDVDAAEKTATKAKKKSADEEDEDASKPKDAEDMKSRIMKGIFGR